MYATRVRLGALLFGAALSCFGQLEVKNEDVSVRFGFQGQFWADWNQDSTAGNQGYQQNLYMRRGRLIASGAVGDNITFFLDTDSPNLGKTPKALNSGFLIQDAVLEWKVNNALQVNGGVMMVPFSRQGLQSTISYYSLDISSVSTVANGPTGSSALRDMGFGARGYFFNDRLSYRFGAFQGQRDANSRNSLRTAGYLQWDFFDREKGYTYVGTALGKKKILAVDAGMDKQGSYRAYSANVASDTPVRHGDEVGFNLQYLHFDGRQKFLSIPQQNNLLAEASYYSNRAKLQPFGRYERQAFTAEVNRMKNVQRCGGGVNVYVRGQSLKWTAQILHAIPGTGSPLAPANEFTVQMQFYYF